MPQIELGGKVIATQSGTNNPVLASNVVMDNVNINNALASAMFPAGHVLQTMQSIKTDIDSTRISNNDSGFADILGTDQNGTGTIFCVKITPKYSSSKIMVIPSINVGGDDVNFVYLRLVRDSTPIFIGNTSANKASMSFMSYSWATNEGVVDLNTFMFLDSPTINTTPQEFVYKVQYACASGSDNVGTATINYSFRDAAGNYYDARTASSITVMEIAQ